MTFFVVRKTPHSLLTVSRDSGSKLFASRQIHRHKKNQGFIVPSPLILKAPPRNHALVGDLHVFGNIEWGCFSYEEGMRPKMSHFCPASYLGAPHSKAPSPEDLEVWKRVISASWQLWGSPLVEKNGVARS